MIICSLFLCSLLYLFHIILITFLCSCFLSNPIVFWLAFLGPVLAIILVNTVIFIIVIFILVRHTRGTLSRKNESMGIKTVACLMMTIVGIMFLFGISWLFAALTVTVEKIRYPSQVLFTIFNSLQGVFIFVYFCIFKKEARESWKEVLSCGKYKSAFLNPSIKWNKTTSAMQIKTKLSSQSMNYKLKSAMSTTTILTRESSLSIVLENTCNDMKSGSDIYCEPEEDLSNTKIIN